MFFCTDIMCTNIYIYICTYACVKYISKYIYIYIYMFIYIYICMCMFTHVHMHAHAQAHRCLHGHMVGYRTHANRQVPFCSGPGACHVGQAVGSLVHALLLLAGAARGRRWPGWEAGCGPGAVK